MNVNNEHSHGVLRMWHDHLGMPIESQKWYEQDLRDEMAEYHEEKFGILKLSELSDVVYTCSRAAWNGYSLTFPFSPVMYALGAAYMLPKYTLRWAFFKKAGNRAGSSLQLRDVRNPRKTHKLRLIANENSIDPDVFERVCKAQLKYWLLLP